MRGINVVRFPSPVDPPATSQDQALHKVAIFTGSPHAGRRIDHASRDAWKAQPVELSHFQIFCCVHRSVPIAVENRNAYPDDLIPRIVNHRLRRTGRRRRRVGSHFWIRETSASRNGESARRTRFPDDIRWAVPTRVHPPQGQFRLGLILGRIGREPAVGRQQSAALL